MGLKEELVRIDSDKIVETYEAFWQRIRESGEDPAELAESMGAQYPALDAVVGHIKSELETDVRQEHSPREIEMAAYGAALAMMAIKQHAETQSLRELFEGPNS